MIELENYLKMTPEERWMRDREATPEEYAAYLEMTPKEQQQEELRLMKRKRENYLKEVQKSLEEKILDRYVFMKEDRIEITKDFAETFLSATALEQASLVTETSYSWAATGIHYLLHFELPALFDTEAYTTDYLITLVRLLERECRDYIDDLGITKHTYEKLYNKNKKKPLAQYVPPSKKADKGE